MTPRTLGTAIAARARAFDREHRDRAWLAHTTASLGRVKKMPKLSDLTKVVPAAKKPKPQRSSPDAMLAKARLWQAVSQR